MNARSQWMWAACIGMGAALAGIHGSGPEPALRPEGCAAVEHVPEPAPRRSPLPAYSEEREAAALHFVKRHAADLLPLLEKLKKSDGRKYEQEIREIFQVSELITNLCSEDTRRCALELDLWKTEAKSLILVTRLASLKEEELEKAKEDLLENAKKLIDLDMQILKMRVDDLEKELAEAKTDLKTGEEKRDALGKERYEKLLELAKRRGMMR